jgi:lysyl-tRNA synthetase class 2
LSSAGASDPHLINFVTQYSGPGSAAGRALFLHTSPEYPMKRLLAAGSGSIYQIAKVFRNGEAGRQHNPEFTLLEWYRTGFDHYLLMDEVADLMMELLPDREFAAIERVTYHEAFRRYLGIDIYRATVLDLANCAMMHGVSAPCGMTMDDPDPWFDLLLTHRIQPELGANRLTFLYDYPVSQAALARVRDDTPPVGERFELYVDGIELANGFHELGDVNEQRRRFVRDNELRLARELPAIPLDELLLDALAAGLPACAGVALGFDRLLMIAIGADSLGEVLAFPFDRA